MLLSALSIAFLYVPLAWTSSFPATDLRGYAAQRLARSQAETKTVGRCIWAMCQFFYKYLNHEHISPVAVANAARRGHAAKAQVEACFEELIVRRELAINHASHEPDYLHNHMRMYWGRKIPEWSNTREYAFRTTLHLNNHYARDGRTPSSFANVTWVFGLLDWAWAERDVYGKVRYRNGAGLRRKADPEAYVGRVERRTGQSVAGDAPPEKIGRQS